MAKQNLADNSAGRRAETATAISWKVGAGTQSSLLNPIRIFLFLTLRRQGVEVVDQHGDADGVDLFHDHGGASLRGLEI